MNRTTQQNPDRYAHLRRAGGTLLASLLLVLSAQAQTAADKPATSVQVSDAIQRYLADMQGERYSRMEADVQPLDSRLRLSPCDQPLAVDHYPRERTGGRITFKVSCSGPDSWSVRIPASVQLFDDVVVAATGIPMGSQIGPRDVQLQEMDVSLLYRGYFGSIDDVKGFIAKRPIPAGQVLSATLVNPANVVTKGEKVTILAESSGVSTGAMGEALADGALGDLIQVRNSSSSRVVEGRISGPGLVKVAF